MPHAATLDGWVEPSNSHQEDECRSSEVRKRYMMAPFVLSSRKSKHSTKLESDLIAALLGSWIGTLLWPTSALRGYRNYVNTHH